MHEHAIPIGNFENKYATANPIARRMVDGFLTSFDELVAFTRPSSIHEVGCGEGMLTARLQDIGAGAIRATDLTEDVFHEIKQTLPPSLFTFEAKNIYDLTFADDHADLVICCEVLEHLEDPHAGLDRLRDLEAKQYLFSVPCEPIWRMLNMVRGKYIRQLGNTPGHLNHWSGDGFCNFLNAKFEILETRAPLPWTMALCVPRAQK